MDVQIQEDLYKCIEMAFPDQILFYNMKLSFVLFILFCLENKQIKNKDRQVVFTYLLDNPRNNGPYQTQKEK